MASSRLKMKGGSSSSVDMLYFILLAILSVLIGFMFYVYIIRETTFSHYLANGKNHSIHVNIHGSRLDELNDPYVPPLKTDNWMPSFWYNNVDSHIVPPGAHVPINIKTRGIDTDFQQVGFLNDDGKILPLMGRNLYNGRDKSQYFTMANEGNVNTRLPVKLKGRSCTGEYGCDSVYDGDSLYVEGLDKEFKVKLYENATLRYI